MRTLVGMVLLLLVALMLVTAYLGLQAPEAPVHARFAREVDQLLAAVPDLERQRELRSRAGTLATAVSIPLSFHAPRLAVQAQPLLVLSVVRASLAVAVLPVLGTLVAIGVLLGLLRRRLLIESLGFHSLTFSYLGKALAASSAAAYAFTGLSPLAPPPWMLYVFAAAISLGAALWFGNLPPKL